jgi:hypothetical protein
MPTQSHLFTNAHLYAAARTINDMQAIADDQSLSEYQRLLARQTQDLALALHRSFAPNSASTQ